MRTNLLARAPLLLALLAAAPLSAEEAVDAAMAEAAAEQAAMEAEAAIEQAAPMAEAPAEQDAPMAEAPAEQDAAEVESTVREEVVGTQLGMSGPAALPAQDIDVPLRGMHMDQVRARYGRPMGVNPPVGEPPITRWDYPGYAVYFEYSYVIQSVPK